MTNTASALLIAKNTATDSFLLPAMANRHGCITGATGTGKTVTLQAMAQALSEIGVPVFMADVKGDLTGISQAGGGNARVNQRFNELNLPPPQWRGCPVQLWDVFGEQGHPVRATVADMGPVLLARLLGLNETQTGVLNIVFRVADDQGLLLLDLKDLRAMCQHVGDTAADYVTQYGNVSVASIGAIQRGLLGLEDIAKNAQGQRKDVFFGEPMLNISDMLQTLSGQGVVNILAADRLLQQPMLYAMTLLWLLSELHEALPEAGDMDKPKIVFFFDEAHLLFADAPDALIKRIEQTVRLIRSKGVGVYFVTQNPLDIPDTVLAQLSNRVQHALRAFTPRDQKAVKAAAETMRPNTGLNIEQVITELAVGEALVSFLDEKGRPTPTERSMIVPPASRIGAISGDERQAILDDSLVAGVYDKAIDRDSAYEKLTGRVARMSEAVTPTAIATEPVQQDSWGRGGGAATPQAQTPQAQTPQAQAPQLTQEQSPQSTSMFDGIGSLFGGAVNSLTQGTGRKDSLVEAMAKSAARSVGSQLGRAVIRGVLGGILGGRR